MSEISDKHPIEGLMGTALQGLREMIDVNAIVGAPINTPDGSVIMPVSKVALGFGVGGTEFPKSKKLLTDGENPSNMFGGGTGGGLSLTPVGFLVVGNGKIRMVPVSEQNSIYDRLIDAVPTAIDKISEFVASVKNNSAVMTDAESAPDDDEEEDVQDEDTDSYSDNEGDENGGYSNFGGYDYSAE